MSSVRDRQLQQARALDDASTVMIRLGAEVVRRNPIKVGLYVVGVLICLVFSGFAIQEEHRIDYYKHLNTIDRRSINQVEDNLMAATYNYRNTKGWFSCDSTCTAYKTEMERLQQKYNILKYDEEQKMSAAKAALGLFSEHGVDETRNLFWTRFGQGKGFATRQSKWDALFIGMSSMGRDESFVNYIFRILLNALFNFTIGVVGAVVAFIWGLVGLIRSYQANILVALTFFFFASLAAMSFAITWLIGLYAATAGTVYVGVKFLAANARIQNDPNNAQYRHRVN